MHTPQTTLALIIITPIKEPIHPREDNRPLQSDQHEISKETRKILCTKLSRESPGVEISSNDLLHSMARFLVDTVANINIIKLESLDEVLLVGENMAIGITGKTQSRISTIGRVNIKLMKAKIIFHVEHSGFPTSTDGILGREYLRQEKVEISFWHNTIVTHSNLTKPIQFIDSEPRVALESTTNYKGPMLGPIQVREQGYLPLIKTTEGILIGEAAVTDSNGICHVFAINTTEEDIDVELPPQEIIPLEYYKFPGEDFDEDSTDEDYSPPMNKSLGSFEPE